MASIVSTKTDYVYQSLKAQILEGKLAPGLRLRLSELAGQFGISEMPVRESLRMLQRDGLIYFENHRGATVATLTLQEVVDVIATRTHLEVLAISESTPHHKKETLGELDELMARMRRAPTHQYTKLNRVLHETLYRPCPNEFLKAEINELWERVWKRWTPSLFVMRPDRRKGAHKEHALIVEAIRSRSVLAVEKAVQIHRRHTLEEWRGILGKTGKDENAEPPSRTRGAKSKS